MGQLIDLVPNHMGVLGADNALVDGRAGERHGVASTRSYFDIEWQPLDAGPRRQGAAAGAGRSLRRGARTRRAAAAGTQGDALRARLRATSPLACGYFEPPLSALLASIARLARPPAAHAARWPSARDKDCSRAAGAARRHGECLDRAVTAAATRRAARAAGGAGLAARPLARGRRRDQLPALLRRQRTRRAAHRATRTCSRPRTRWRSTWRPAAGSTACASTIPTACMDPAQYFERLQDGFARAPAAAAALDDDGRPQRPLYVVAEKIAAPARGRAGVVGRARHHRLPLCQRGQRRAGRPSVGAAAWSASGAASRACASDFDDVVYEAKLRGRARHAGLRPRGARQRPAAASPRPTARTRDHTLQHAARGDRRRWRPASAVYRTYNAESRERAGPALHRPGDRRGTRAHCSSPDAVGVRLRARTRCSGQPPAGADAHDGARRRGASRGASSSSAHRWRPRAWRTRPSTATFR